jgi:hypothetical protein
MLETLDLWDVPVRMPDRSIPLNQGFAVGPSARRAGGQE